MEYMVKTSDGFKTYFSKKSHGTFADLKALAGKYAKRTGGEVFYKNTGSYKFMKDGEVCRGSGLWLLA